MCVVVTSFKKIRKRDSMTMIFFFLISIAMGIRMYQNDSKLKHQTKLKALLATLLFSCGLNEYGQ